MRHEWSIFALVAVGTVIGLMGTDLILPAIPILPEDLGGTAAAAQLVLASYVAGTCAGLIAYGALSDHISVKSLLFVSLAGLAFTSIVCSLVTSLPTLIVVRAIQGFVAAAPAVFAPAIIKSIFDEQRATNALGLLGSIESLAPALAPVVGAALLSVGTWQLSFELLAVLAASLALLVIFIGRFPNVETRQDGGFRKLLSNVIYLRYAISQALVLGGLLTFVFGVPAIFVRVLGGSIDDFIILQICSIATFILAANVSSRLVDKFGAEQIIFVGTSLAAASSTAQLLYALSGGHSVFTISLLAIPMSTGLGLRGPPGFYRAILAADGDDARASAIVVLGILGAAATGTALASPWIDGGIGPLASITLVFHVAAVAALMFLPKLPETVGSIISP